MAEGRETPPIQAEQAKKPKTEEAPGKKHSIQFRLAEKVYHVDCTDRMTILEALSTHDAFNEEKDKAYVVIARKDDAVVSAHFPCSLIDSQEELTVSFISGPGQNETSENEVHDKENLVAFNVETRGKKGVINILKNKELANSHSYVCVYGVKGQQVLEALKDDGRFEESIFKKNIELTEVGGNQKTFLMSNKVDKLKDLKFKITPGKGSRKKKAQAEGKDPCEKQTGSQKVKTEPSVASTSSPGPQAENTDPGQDSANAQPQTPKKIQVKEIPNTEEVLKLLRGQFAGLLKQLKERESLTKPAEVQRFFREEYDKSAQSFSEVKRVKDLMKLSDSVCLVCVEGSPRGTGFLLFGRFVLTNAHVVGEFDPFTQKLQRSITAVFGYEDLDDWTKLPVKEKLVAYYHGKDEKGQHLDFALLELSDEAKLDCPELLSKYSSRAVRGGICIVGHPDGGVKRMDPCFIIEKKKVSDAADRHLVENRSFLNVITQQYFTDKWEYNNSQISYDSCFFHGSSGSPVFNEHCELIGVHTGGYAYKGEGGRTRSVMEYALPMLPILVSIVRQSSEQKISDIIQAQVANEQNQAN